MTLQNKSTKEILKELKEVVEGPIFGDSLTLHVYSVDASIFEVLPTVVVIPAHKQDILSAIHIANRYNIPITVRGAATGITGGCLGRGIILDVSKSLNRLLEVNSTQNYALCEPGLVQDELNERLAPEGLRLGPDTSTGNRATLGGMLANNAAGSRSLRFGKMVDAVLEVELALSDGSLIRLESLDEKRWGEKLNLPTREGIIYREADRIRKAYLHEIESRFPSIPRRVSGYNLDELIKPFPLNLSKIIAGSEGTLGIVTEIKMAVVPKMKASGLCLLFFDTLLASMQPISQILAFHPTALELIDDQIIELGRLSPSLRGQLDWLPGHPKALLIVELEGESAQKVEEKVRSFSSFMNQKQIGYSQVCLCDPIQMEKVWKLRKAGLGILLSKRSYSRAIAFIEDISVKPERLADFMKHFCQYLESKGKIAGIYGHAGSGCMHVRPYMNLQDPSEVVLMKQMMREVALLLVEYGGSLSGEHGDGLIRSWLNPLLFGDSLMQAFKELKQAFDPTNLFNPGKIVPFSSEWEELRTQPKKPLTEPKTFLNFSSEGGFALAVDLCNGNGLCRKKDHVMCPSFQVTNEEFHSTRARAQALRSIIQGRLPIKDFTSKGMLDVMDLCLSCKGCKTECPSQVDMAKMKSEFLYHYQKEHGFSLRSRLFGSIGKLIRWAALFASFFNKASQWPLSKKLFGWIGITPKRALPPLATQRFSEWFQTFQQPNHLTQSVILFNDTFNEFNHPHVGQTAVHVLNELGFRVIVPQWRCCGRPALSKGLLELARQQAKDLLQQMTPLLQNGIPLIGLEPSCILTIKDDYAGLLPSDDPLFSKLEEMVNHCQTLDEFLAGLLKKGHFNLSFHPFPRSVYLHGHCYQKAVVGMEPTLTVLKAIPGFQVHEIPSGCCGMAGSFGYEKEHYDISMQIGELCLFPSIRESSLDSWIVASGTSCRHQIADGTKRESMHLAEAIFATMMQKINF